jgi:hypothetical protein
VAYRDLREFINGLERKGELKAITTEVDVDLEIAEITDRSVKRNCARALSGAALTASWHSTASSGTPSGIRPWSAFLE